MEKASSTLYVAGTQLNCSVINPCVGMAILISLRLGATGMRSFYICSHCKTDNLGGLEETTGGSAVAGDSRLDAALREVKEELGLVLFPESGRLFHSYVNKGFNGYKGFTDVWVFDSDCSLEDVVLQESETCDVMWASGDKIREMVENGEFIGCEIYPYLDKLLGYEV